MGGARRTLPDDRSGRDPATLAVRVDAVAVEVAAGAVVLLDGAWVGVAREEGGRRAVVPPASRALVIAGWRSE